MTARDGRHLANECKEGYALHHGERSPNMHKPYNNSSLIVACILLRSATLRTLRCPLLAAVVFGVLSIVTVIGSQVPLVSTVIFVYVVPLMVWLRAYIRRLF